MAPGDDLIQRIGLLDSYCVNAAGLRSQLEGQTRAINRTLAEIRGKIIAGETTGLPLNDWALLAHGADYPVIASLASSLLKYLQKPSGELVVLARHTETHTGSLSFLQEKSFYLAVLGAPGFYLPRVSANLSNSPDVLSTLVLSTARVFADTYAEKQNKMSYHASFHISEGMRISHFFFGLHPLACVDESGYSLSIRSTRQGDTSLNELAETKEHHFSVFTDTRIRFFAGTESVLAYLRENFWSDFEPPAAAYNFIADAQAYLADRAPDGHTH